MIKSMYLQLKMPALVAAMSAVISSSAFADRSGFYTIIGPNGQIMVIDRNAADKPSTKPREKSAEELKKQNSSVASVEPSKTLENDKEAASPVVEAPAPVAILPVISEDKSRESQPVNLKKEIAITSEKMLPHKTPEVRQEADKADIAKSPVTTIDGVQYVDSEYLEQKEFNLDNKKRFYTLPDGMGGKQVLERQKGVDMNLFHGPAVPQQPKVVALSGQYQRISAADITQLTGVQCFSEQQLKRTKLLKLNETTDFWPKPSFEPKFDFVVAKFDQTVQDVELTSYASTIKNPKFYWPLPVFLDEKGCVMEGVNAFYLRTLPSNVSQHEAIQGYLHVPQSARYLLLTPLEAAADLKNIQLSNQGQIRLTSIR